MIVTMPKTKIEYVTPLTCSQIALDMGGEVYAHTVCALVDGAVVDLSYCIARDCALEMLDLTDERARKVYQHSAALILGQAVKAVYPTAKLGAVDATAKGFAYEIAFASAPSADADRRIAEEMRDIIHADLPIEREEMSRTAAKALMRRFGEYYKIQYIEAMPKGQRVSVYHLGDYVDMSRGPLVCRTGCLYDVRVLSVARVPGEGCELWRIEGEALPAPAAREERCCAAKTQAGRPKKCVKNS